jgi:predicted ATP-dependent endonuclease of OLD family
LGVLAMAIYLQGLGLRNYRGIGPEWLYMHSFKNFNFFIGANNSGKSNVLSFISRNLSSDRYRAKDVQPLDYHGGAVSGSIDAAIAVSESEVVESLMSKSKTQSQDKLRPYVSAIVKTIADKNGYLWKEFSVTQEDKVTLKYNCSEVRSAIDPNLWKIVWASFTGRSGGGLNEHWIPETLNVISHDINIDLPSVKIIPAMRRVGEAGSTFGDYSGSGLIAQLATIQNPSHDRRKDKLLFDKINEFLRSVLDKPLAQIEIPHDRAHILVHMDDRVLPLSSLGTGIEEVIMLAAFCTLSDKCILCIEEPEIHLHPLLQRKLMSYLQVHTNNQYFIATHSASFIDTPEAAIFHVRMDQNQTRITEAVLREERFAVCMDLGHRASDIIQANAVIWVEGPSDRVYLKFWLQNVGHELIEGIHYTIMFYGGRLLSHLSANDEDVSEFIQLRNLNRHVAIVLDSDKNSPYVQINQTKRRIVDEFSKSGIAWVTKGREIENYIEYSALQEAIKRVYTSVYDKPLAGGQFDHALYFQRTSPRKTRISPPGADLIEKNVDKVKISRNITESTKVDLSQLDLEARVHELVTFIRRANK